MTYPSYAVIGSSSVSPFYFRRSLFTVRDFFKYRHAHSNILRATRLAGIDDPGRSPVWVVGVFDRDNTATLSHMFGNRHDVLLRKVPVATGATPWFVDGHGSGGAGEGEEGEERDDLDEGWHL